MSPARWRLIEEIYHSALELTPERQPAFLDQACGGDAELRREIESLLRQGVSKEALVDRPAWEAAGELLESRAKDWSGQTISHYQILEKLGEGGMGVVYKAQDTRLHRFVAIKVVNAEFTQRFQREARAISALNHPHICTLYDVGEQEGSPYLVMEYVEGQPLKGPLPVDQVLPYAIQTAQALAVAHKAGIVHRDLKPDNILLTSEGSVKVLDFGLAKLQPTVKTDVPTLATMTEQGAIAGTGPYMSPEQAQGEPVDARSDIFSFGAVLYELLSGRRAFRRETMGGTLAAVIALEPPPLGEAPSEVARIVGKMLAKKRESRYQSAEELLADLRATAQPRVRFMSRGRWIGLGLGVVVAAAALWVWGTQRGTRGPGPEAPVPFTSSPGYECYPSFSPDGSEVAFVWNGEKQDNPDIYLKQIGLETISRFTTGPEEETAPAWSPDGRFIAFIRVLPLGKVAVVLKPQRGGPEQKLAEMFLQTEGTLGPFLAWTPDAKNLIVAGDDDGKGPHGLFLLPIESRELRRLLPPPDQGFGDTGPAISPDGETLAFYRIRVWGASRIHLVELGPDFMPRGKPRDLTDGLAPTWTAGGEEIVYNWPVWQQAQLRRIRTSGRGGPRPLPQIGPGSLIPVVSARAHRLLYHATRGSLQDIWKVDLGQDPPRTPAILISSTAPDGAPEFSPDGAQIAFTSNRSGNGEIWLCNRDGTEQVKLTSFGRGAVYHIDWSPDGSRIAFSAAPDENVAIFVIDATGGKPRQITNSPSGDSNPRWSRDGRWIYFTSNRAAGPQTWKVPSQGGAPVQVTREGEGFAQESPDGRTLYFIKPGEGLWRMPTGGGVEEQVIAPPFTPPAQAQWKVVKDGVYYTKQAATGSGAEIRFYSIARKSDTQVLAFDEMGTYGLTISPDGKTLLYSAINLRLGLDLMLVENFR